MVRRNIGEKKNRAPNKEGQKLRNDILTIINDTTPISETEIPLEEVCGITVLDYMPYDRGKASVLAALNSILMREATSPETLTEKERSWLNRLNEWDREWLKGLLTLFVK